VLDDSFVELLPLYPRYFINKDGVVVSTRRTKEVIIAHTLSPDGYPTIKLRNADGNGETRRGVHRVLAEVFLPRKEGQNQVNHKDGNKKNFKLENLEWVTQQENLYHAMRTGLHPNPMKSVIGWNPDTGHGWFFFSITEAAKYGFTQANLSHCLAGHRAKCKGYHWEYA